MKVKQEPKYEAVDGRLVNRATGTPIPDDEPVFILRAKDKAAVEALEWYAMQCSNPDHVEAVDRRIKDFQRFARANPDRMKQPDTAPQNGSERT